MESSAQEDLLSVGHQCGLPPQRCLSLSFALASLLDLHSALSPAGLDEESELQVLAVDGSHSPCTLRMSLQT